MVKKWTLTNKPSSIVLLIVALGGWDMKLTILRKVTSINVLNYARINQCVFMLERLTFEVNFRFDSHEIKELSKFYWW